ATLVFAFVMTVLIFKLLAPLGLRVPAEEEEEGLDLSTHGEEAYRMEVNTQENVSEERIAQLEAGNAELRMLIEMQNRDLRMRVQMETAELRQQLQVERIAHLEAENSELRTRLESVTNPNLRAYNKQFAAPTRLTKLG